MVVIKDTCKCGAEFSVTVDRSTTTLTVLSGEAKEAHVHWLEMHSDCRQRHLFS